MIRRLMFLPLAAVAMLSLVLAACTQTPAAPALTDPKEIVTKGVTALADVKTLEFTASFTGNVSAANMGSFDLTTIKMAGAVDVANKKAKFSLDAPSLLGSKLEALVLSDAVYYKVAGALAAALPGQADKYTKMAIPTGAADPATAMTDMTKLVAELQTGLEKLPSPLTKSANEKCGDLDCYHVSTAVTADQVGALGLGQNLDGAVTVDLWTRTTDYRPARIAFSMNSSQLGSFGMAVDIRYDVSISVEAPPADQVVQ